jgi:hypothetical protein
MKIQYDPYKLSSHPFDSEIRQDISRCLDTYLLALYPLGARVTRMSDTE